MRRSLAPAAVALAALALSGTSVAGQQLEMDEAEVRLLDPGAEPRQLLRYEFTEGHADTLRIDTDLGMSVTMDGLDVMTFDMPMSMTTNTTVSEVFEDSARVEYVISDWDFGDMGGLLPDSEELEAAMETIDGIGGWMVLDTRGAVLDYGVVLPEGMPEEMVAQSEQVVTEVELLPEEPVGVGASWESVMSTAGGGIDMEMLSTSTIVSMDEDVIILDQAFASDLVPDLGGLLDMGDLLGDSFMETRLSGGGTSEVRLDRVSQPGEMEIVMDMVMGIDDGERVSEVTFAIAMDVVATLVDG